MSYVECLMDALNLFSFPTYMGTPIQRPIGNRLEALRFVKRHDGITGVHIRLNTEIFDKVLFEFELKERRGREELLDLCDTVLGFLDDLRSSGFDDNVLLFFSGNKSFYVYLFFEPVRLNEETASYATKRIYEHFLDEEYEKYLDKNFANPYHMIRLPNTRHEATGYVVKYVNPVMLGTDFWEHELYSRTPVRIPRPRRPRLVTEFIRPELVEEPPPPETGEELTEGLELIAKDLLKEVLRPCIYQRLMTDPDPPHIVRTAMVSELMYSGFSRAEVLRLIESLGWTDYDPETTRYHVEKIYEKRLLPPSKKKLKIHGICNDCGRCILWWEAIWNRRT